MSHKRLGWRVLTVVAVFGLVIAACGGATEADNGVATLEDDTSGGTLASQEDPSVGGDGAEDVEQTREEALLAFTACLRENGVDVEDPTVDADGNVQLNRPGAGQGGQGAGADEDFRAAREACADLLDNAALGFERPDQTELQDNLIAFAECVRDNGYDMPDPDFSSFGPGQGGGGGPFGDLDREDPAFIEATEACEDILAGFGRGFGGGRPGGGGGDG